MENGGKYGISIYYQNGKKWNVSRRRVTTLCIQGCIDGAVHKGNVDDNDVLRLNRKYIAILADMYKHDVV